jgi:hypothetical protein
MRYKLQLQKNSIYIFAYWNPARELPREFKEGLPLTSRQISLSKDSSQRCIYQGTSVQNLSRTPEYPQDERIEPFIYLSMNVIGNPDMISENQADYEKFKRLTTLISILREGYYLPFLCQT